MRNEKVHADGIHTNFFLSTLLRLRLPTAPASFSFLLFPFSFQKC